jgi:hypothetical protein
MVKNKMAAKTFKNWKSILPVFECFQYLDVQYSDPYGRKKSHNMYDVNKKHLNSNKTNPHSQHIFETNTEKVT